MNYEVTVRVVIDAHTEQDAETQVLAALENIPGEVFLVNSQPTTDEG